MVLGRSANERHLDLELATQARAQPADVEVPRDRGYAGIKVYGARGAWEKR